MGSLWWSGVSVVEGNEWLDPSAGLPPGLLCPSPDHESKGQVLSELLHS